MIDVKNLKFFDKNGYNYNFTYDDVSNKWTGVVLMDRCSVGLYSNSDIFILEKHGNELVRPYSDVLDEEVKFEWDSLNTFVDEIFLFDYDSNFIKSETSSLQYTYQDGVDLVPKEEGVTFKLGTRADDKTCLQLHIGFTSTPGFDESTYKRTLFGLVSGKVFLEVTFIAESIEEDERLKTLCENLGYNINNNDSKIFKDYPLDEYYPDYKLLNNKRKEILLEGCNIFPYVGSYKALTNAIKYFGYDNVGIVEYWKNRDTGMLFKTDKYSINEKESIRVDGQKITLPNKDYKKTNRISLTYDINRVTDKFDDLGLPITEEYFSYSIEEAINKLQLLRKKLDKDFMPGSSHLNDVIGEGDYFGLHRIESSPQFDSCNHINCGLTPSFTVSQNKLFITKNTNFANFIAEKLNDSDDTFIEGEDYIIESEDTIAFTNKGLVKAWRLYLDGDTIDIKSMKFEPHDDSDSDIKPFYLFDEDDDEDDDTKKSCAKFICHCDSFDDVKIEDVIGVEKDRMLENIEYYKYGDFKEIEWIAYHKDGDIDENNSSGRCDIVDNIDYYFKLEKNETYTIVCNLYDAFNNCSTVSKTVTVDPLNIELLGFYNDARPLDIEYSDEEQKQFSLFRDHLLQLAYSQRLNKEQTSSIQVSNYKKGFDDYGNSDSDSDIKKGPYKWNNLDYFRWLNSEHLTLDITNHIQDDSTLRFIHNGVCLRPYTWVCVGTDFTRIADIVLSSIKWTLVKIIDGTDEVDSSFKTVTENYPTFTYLLPTEGSYRLKCELNDKHGNTYSVSRNLFRVSKTSTYDNYIDFKKDNRYFK